MYLWETSRLLEVGTREEILLSESEQAVLQEILRSRRIGAEAELVLEEDIAALRARSPEEFARLARLLDLKITSPAAPSDAPGSDG